MGAKEGDDPAAVDAAPVPSRVETVRHGGVDRVAGAEADPGAEAAVGRLGGAEATAPLGARDVASDARVVAVVQVSDLAGDADFWRGVWGTFA